MPAKRSAFDKRLRMSGAPQTDDAESRHWAARCEALWSALSPKRGLSAPQPDGSIRLGAWRAAEAVGHPVLAPLCGHLLGTQDTAITLTWRPGTGVISVAISSPTRQRVAEVSL